MRETDITSSGTRKTHEKVIAHPNIVAVKTYHLRPGKGGREGRGGRRGKGREKGEGGRGKGEGGRGGGKVKREKEEKVCGEE